jgi:hypothetical protein
MPLYLPAETSVRWASDAVGSVHFINYFLARPLRLAKTNAGSSTVFCDELNSGLFEGAPHIFKRTGILYVEWIYPSHFNFREPSAARELSELDEKMWGPWQRQAVPCL